MWRVFDVQTVVGRGGLSETSMRCDSIVRVESHVKVSCWGFGGER